MGASTPAAPHGVRNSILGLLGIIFTVVSIICLILYLQRRKNNRCNPDLPTASSSPSAWGRVKKLWPGDEKTAVVRDVESQVEVKNEASEVAVPPPTFLVTRPNVMSVLTPGLGPKVGGKFFGSLQVVKE